MGLSDEGVAKLLYPTHKPDATVGNGALTHPADGDANLPSELWPVMGDAAFHGIVGKIKDVIAPHTEADPVALLSHCLSEFSCLIGRGPHVCLDGGYSPLSFWPVVVGDTSKARKGSADKRIKRLFQAAFPHWTRGESRGGLSSGEGLVYAIRDPILKLEMIKERGKPTGETVEVMVDEGVTDKRIYLVQTEFGSMLKIMGREGNSLSGVIRDAWDGEDLRPMTKNSRISATEPHVVIVGHVTNDELLRHLSETEMANGFGNRFAWIAVRRANILPFASNPPEDTLQPLIRELGEALAASQRVQEITLTEETKDLWREIYSKLAAGKLGMVGALLGRAEAQVRRIAALYALLDQKQAVASVHLNAALAVWDYAEASTRLIFGQRIGDPVADAILQAVQTNGVLTDTQVSDLFRRNVPASRLESAKSSLLASGVVCCEEVETNGRPKNIWKLPTKKTN